MKHVFGIIIILFVLIGAVYLVAQLVAEQSSEHSVVSNDMNTGFTDVVGCLPNERNVDACIEIYDPVCGLVQVECITEPCDPIPETFSNACFACQNERVVSYVNGECK